MKISIILAPPHPGSFNYAIADEAAAVLRKSGHTVTVHDLYREQSDPLLPYNEIPRDAPLPPAIALHCAEIAAADGIVFIHPDGWGMQSVIFKGWIDRVLRHGVAGRFAETDAGDGIPVGLPAAKAVLVFNTSNTPAEREREVFGDPLVRTWKDAGVSFCGVPVFLRRMSGVVVASTEEQRTAWLNEVREITGGLVPPA